MYLKNKIKVTVYIPCYNYGNYLSRAIESVLKQTFEDWELLIFDDNSEDNTQEVISKYKHFPSVRTFKTKRIGLCKIANLAIKESRGDFLIRLDADDIFNENILEILVNYFNKNKDLALIFPDYYLINESGEIFSEIKRSQLNQKDNSINQPPNGACMMIRKTVLKEIGGYREDLGAQDGFDVWSRIFPKYKTFNVNLPLFYYRRHVNNMTNSPRRIIDARRAIKRDVAREKLKRISPIICVIPCRKYFDFTKQLWKKIIGNKSLLEIVLESCLNANIFDEIIVASDDKKTKLVLDKFKNEKVSFFLRDTKETIRNSDLSLCLNNIMKLKNVEYSGLTFIKYLQTPFLDTETIKEALHTMVINEVDCTVGVEEITDQLYKRTSFGLEPINKLKDISTNYDYVYRETLTCCLIKNRNLINGNLYGSNILNYVVPSAECFKVESFHDLEVANIMYKKIS